MKGRNHTFDFLSGVCIILMVTNHAIAMCGHKPDEWWQCVMRWSFYIVCFFFFKSGYFYKTSDKKASDYLKDKVKRLLIPYICWGVIGFAIYAFFLPFEIKRYGHPVEPMEWSHLWNTSSVWGNEPLWFLFSFFVTYIVVYFLKKMQMMKHGIAIQAVLVIIFPFVGYWLWMQDNPLPMSLNNVFIGVFFMYLGMGWKWCLGKLSKRQALIVCSLLVIVFVVSNIMWHGEYYIHANRFAYNPIAAIVNISMVMLGLSGLGMKVSLPRIPVINYIGEHSLVFYVAHYPVLQFYRFTHISFGHSIYGRYDNFIIMLILTFCFCFWIVPWVEKRALLSGRKN